MGSVHFGVETALRRHLAREIRRYNIKLRHYHMWGDIRVIRDRAVKK